MSSTSSRRLSLGIVAVLLLALIVFLVLRLLAPAREQRTDDAYVRADFTLLAPKVSGQVAEVLVEDNQPVQAGQLLARIDDRDYRAALDAAEADVLAAEARHRYVAADLERQRAVIGQSAAQIDAGQAEYVFARQELSRYEQLVTRGAGTVQNAQQARSKIDTAKARVKQDQAAAQAAHKQLEVIAAQQAEVEGALQRALAQREQARLNLSYTEIRAPFDGMVGRRAVRVGAYVGPGDALLAVVPLQQAYVVANFQETQLTHVQPGQPVRLEVDSFPGEELHGHVDSIAPATGLSFAPIAPDNATGNFTKVVQRIPVKVVLDADQPLLARLRVGMSVIARIDTGATPEAKAQLAGR